MNARNFTATENQSLVIQSSATLFTEVSYLFLDVICHIECLILLYAQMLTKGAIYSVSPSTTFCFQAKLVRSHCISFNIFAL
jgi:hypothetical protein